MGIFQFFNILLKNDKDQRTPLHLACSNGNLPIVQYLIEKGANIEAKTYMHQDTPLHIAHMVIFQLFNISLKKELILKQRQMKKMPLFILLQFGVDLIN